MPILKRPAPLAALLVGFALSSVAGAQDQPKAAKLSPPPRQIDVPTIKYTEFTLKNGLRVILHEDHSSPIVALDIWYDVGAKNDPPNMLGLAHMFEHMMDEGTSNMANGVFKRTVQQAGGWYNAFTASDWTHYMMVMPSNHLETALWLEAERMVNLDPDSARFANERRAVRNEYRDGIVSSPIGSAFEVIAATLFAGGTYAPTGGGTETSLDSVQVADLLRFYHRYYAPNNAIVTLVGDFTPAEARKLVEKHFDRIPRGKPPEKTLAVPPMFTGEKRLVMEHPANFRQLWLAWRGARSGAPDRPAALALSAILSDRLRTTLLERRLTVGINTSYNANFDLEESGVLQVFVTLNGQGVKPESATEVEMVVDSIIGEIKKNGVTDKELRRWVAGYRLQTISNMQADTSKAASIGDGASNMGDPVGVFRLLERAQRLTPADVQAAANKYMTADRVVLSTVPVGKIELRSKPDLKYTDVTRGKKP